MPGNVFSNEADLSKSLMLGGHCLGNGRNSVYAVSGGVSISEGEVKAILAGASAVEVCSAFYQKTPSLCHRRVHNSLIYGWIKGMTNINQFKGMLNTKDLKGINIFERTQFCEIFLASIKPAESIENRDKVASMTQECFDATLSVYSGIISSMM